MSDVGAIATMVLGFYGLATTVFLISENRRPQSTLAWMLVLFFAPGLGLAAYFLFGRDRKAFARPDRLVSQDLEKNDLPLLAEILARQDKRIAQIEGGSPVRRRLMMLVRRNSRSALTMRNTVAIRQNASSFYPSMIADIKEARHSIHLQYFIWGADRFTRSLQDILAAKAREGVEVRILYDPIGSLLHQRPGYIRRMRAAGVRMVPTSPLWRMHTVSYRNHRKITVIDGAIGYTGGMNIGEEHLDGGEGFDSWRDTQLRLVGESAALLQSVFMIDWYNATGEDLLADRYFSLPRDEPSGPQLPVQILTSGPDSEWAGIRQLYSSMIVAAQRHVFIQSPFFIPDATMAEALKQAALAGIDVRIMLSARASGNRLPDWAGNTYVAEVAAAGVRVFLYQKGYLHAKTISIDSEICSIGSANIDIRSFSINYELNAVLYDRSCARELESDFARDLAACTEFDLAEYRRRNALSRFRDSAARLLSPLL